MLAAGVKLDSRWIPYAETEFTAANYTDLIECATLAVFP